METILWSYGPNLVVMESSDLPVFELSTVNFIRRRVVLPPVKGQYFDNISPVNGECFAEFLALQKKNIKSCAWCGTCCSCAWGNIGLLIALTSFKNSRRIEQHLGSSCCCRTGTNGKAIRESIKCRYSFSGRFIFVTFQGAWERRSSTAELDEHYGGLSFPRTIGPLVGQNHSLEFSNLMPAWKLAPCTGGG